MSKSIKISEEVYERLEQFRDKRESFSQAVERLLDMVDRLGELREVLGGPVKFREWEREKSREVDSADAVRRDVESRTIPKPQLK